jgi:hypothetical protein
MEHRALVRICMVAALAHCGSFFWALGRHIVGNPGIQPNIRLAMGWGDDSSVMLSCMEVAMANTVKPTKEQVREGKDRRQAEPRPPLSQEELRRQLGWDLIEMERNEKRRRS